MVTVTPTPVIPTLDSISIIQDPRDILSYVLRYYATAPKSVSDSTPDAMISLADTTSRYQANPNTMAVQVTTDLTTVYNRFFPPGSLSVIVDTADNGDGSYNITIQLAVILNAVSYTLGADVSVNSTGLLQLKWHPALT